MPWLHVARTGVTALLLHPWRSIATVVCLVAVLVPYIAGLSVAAGLARDAAVSLDAGADLYVTGRQFGRGVPLPRSCVERIATLPGVAAVVPRVVGPIVLGREQHRAVVVGLPPEHVPGEADCIEGRLFHTGPAQELVLGSALASRLKLKVGSLVPPFYRNRAGEHVSEVVGIFAPDAPVWQANLVFTSLDTAAAIFDQPELVTEALVYCRPGQRERVAARIRQQIEWRSPDGQMRIAASATDHGELETLCREAAAHRDGIFHLHCVLACSVAILAVLVTSGYGSTERSREVGILKAIGWQTDEVMLRSAAESLFLSLAGAAISVWTAWLWLRVFNGYGIAGLFLPGVFPGEPVRVPFSLVATPILLAILLAWAVVTSGSLYTTWRMATAPPVTAMQ